MARAGDAAEQTLLRVFYAGHGTWRDCDRTMTASRAIGAQTRLPGALYLRWNATHNQHIRTVMRQLLESTPRYPAACQAAPCSAWSDTAAWDAGRSCAKGRSAAIGERPSRVPCRLCAFPLRRAALPEAPAGTFRYQAPQPSGLRAKTLETGANAIKAWLLLYQTTREKRYLDEAVRLYHIVRIHLLDRVVPLVYGSRRRRR